MFFVYTASLPAAPPAPRTDVLPRARISGTLDWEKLKIFTTISIDLRNSGIRLPAGRSLAEDVLLTQFFAKIEPFILAIPVDSSSTLAGWIERGALSPGAVEALANGARRVPAVYAQDFTSMSASYTIDLADVSLQLVRHTRGREAPLPLTPAESIAYTGILIFAAGELDFYGHAGRALLRPCLFPKIWDTDMNLIYEKTMVEPETFGANTMTYYTKPANVFQNTPSGITADVQARIGDKPLKIIARGAFGISATDPVIAAADAHVIVSSPDVIRLLREGRVAIVVDDSVLVNTIEN
jgi:hypothetical protein